MIIKATEEDASNDIPDIHIKNKVRFKLKGAIYRSVSSLTGTGCAESYTCTIKSVSLC